MLQTNMCAESSFVFGCESPNLTVPRLVLPEEKGSSCRERHMTHPTECWIENQPNGAQSFLCFFSLCIEKKSSEKPLHCIGDVVAQHGLHQTLERDLHLHAIRFVVLHPLEPCSKRFAKR